MKKVIYRGRSKSFNTLKDISELVTEETGQACFLMKEIRHHPYGVTLFFNYWVSYQDNHHMTELIAFGDEDGISQIEKALTSPKCTKTNNVLEEAAKHSNTGHPYA